MSNSNNSIANYFPHDSNARNSDKLIRLRMKHKSSGYGVYFMILERLREEPEYMSVKDYNIIAFDLREDASLIKSVIEDFGLFVFTEDGKYFYSESFKRRMDAKDEKSLRRSESGKKGANARWGNGKVMANASNSDSNAMANASNFIASKGKERKENKKETLSKSLSSFESERVESEREDFFQSCCDSFLSDAEREYQEQMAMKYGITDLAEAFKAFRGKLVEFGLLGEVRTKQDFKRLFVYKYCMLLNQQNSQKQDEIQREDRFSKRRGVNKIAHRPEDYSGSF